MMKHLAAGTVPAAVIIIGMACPNMRGGIDDGLVAGEVRLARQHVHRLRARDARHELHGEDRGVAGRQRLEPGTLVVRRDHGGDERARLQSGEFLGRRPADLQENVGAAQMASAALAAISAPAARNTSSEKRERVARTRLHLHRAPSAVSFFTVSGETATRASSAPSAVTAMVTMSASDYVRAGSQGACPLARTSFDEVRAGAGKLPTSRRN